MVLKQLKVENFSFKMQLEKVGKYSKHELKVFSGLKRFVIDDDNIKIEKVYTDIEVDNVIFIKYENDNVLKTYYLKGLELF